MGVNLVVLRSLSGSLGDSGCLVHPSGTSGLLGSPPGSFGCPEHRSTPPRRDQILNMRKDIGQKAKMHKSIQIRSNSQQNLL